MKLRFLTIWILLAVAACTNPPDRHQFPKLTYGYLPPFKLSVARINIIDQYQSSNAPSHVEKLFPEIPAEVMRRWANDRLKAAGQSGFASFVILRADAIAIPLPRTSGITGTFTTDQSERYDLTLEAKIEVNAGNRAGSANARSFVSQTVAENATLNEREAIWFQMTEKAMNALNVELERQINANLGTLLVP